MLNTFGQVPGKDEIFIPTEPVGLRNNCQKGTWTLNGENVGEELQFIALNYRQYYGDLGKTTDTYWGEIYLYPLTDNVPPCVLRTYIKSVGLRTFNTLIASLLAGGLNPAMGIFNPEFKERTGTNDRGEPISYYTLDFSRKIWKQGSDDDDIFTKLAAAISGYKFPPPNEGNLILLPSDGDARANAIASFKAKKQAQLAPQNNQQQLAPGTPF